MVDETFGPVVGLQKVGYLVSPIQMPMASQVSSDEEAIKLMNDSPYGLTSSIWTNAAANPESEEAFLKIVDVLETGTVFLNRFVSTSNNALNVEYKMSLDVTAWTRL